MIATRSEHSPLNLIGVFMRAGHLTLHETTLSPATEWESSPSGWRLICVEKGIGYVLFNGTVREVGAGQVVVTCTLKPTLFRASSLGILQLLWFRLCPELLTGLLTVYEEHYLQSVAPQSKSALRVISASHDLAKQFAALSGRHGSARTLITRSELLLMFAQLIGSDLRPGHRKNGDLLDASERFKEIIAAAPAAEIQDLSVSELARRCGCSERHFSRLFRAQFGFSLRARQTELRLQKARKLLLESESKVLYVAIESGFHHLGLFNALFKKRFGVTPSEWREQGATKRNIPS